MFWILASGQAWKREARFPRCFGYSSPWHLPKKHKGISSWDTQFWIQIWALFSLPDFTLVSPSGRFIASPIPASYTPTQASFSNAASSPSFFKTCHSIPLGLPSLGTTAQAPAFTCSQEAAPLLCLPWAPAWTVSCVHIPSALPRQLQWGLLRRGCSGHSKPRGALLPLSPWGRSPPPLPSAVLVSLMPPFQRIL